MKTRMTFNDDSVFVHGFCPTEGSWYHTYDNDSIHIGPISLQEECFAPYDWPAWNHELAYYLSSSFKYQVTHNQLIISTTGKYDFKFVLPQLVRIHEIEANNGNRPLLLNSAHDPISGNTEINYFLPETVENAVIKIHNMNSKLMKNIPLYNTGKGITTIYNAEWHAGFYICTLVVDGKEKDSKKMVLTD